MRMITACFARAPQSCTSRTYMHFLLMFEDVRPIRKTRNQFWEKKAPALTVSQVRRLLTVVLPLKVFQADEVLRYVAGMQQRHHRAYLSHRKRRLHEIRR